MSKIRPSENARLSSEAAHRPEQAWPLVERFASTLRDLGVTTDTGRFGARMEVELVHDGPVTIIVDA